MPVASRSFLFGAAACAAALAAGLGASGCEGSFPSRGMPQGVDGPEASFAAAPPSSAGSAAGRPGASAAPAPASDGTRALAVSPAPRAEPGAAPFRTLEWAFEGGPFGPTRAAVVVPGGSPQQRFPVLVAFHGRGESVKGSQQGARAWLDDYALARAIERVSRPPLDAEDFERFATRERLDAFNRGLAEAPYGGLIVVCPFLPDVLKGARAFAEAGPLAAFVVEVLLPRVYATTPAMATPETTGVDGVSLGGRAALLVGLSRPAAFGSVGALQAALDPKELSRFAELGARALRDNPRLALRLLTSDEDYFLRENARLSALLEARGVSHRLVRVPGTHGYRFNRGPGGIEMLLFHDRVLRGLSPFL